MGRLKREANKDLRRQPGRRGFTLLEIVIVATIFSFIGVAVLSAFASGVKMWDRVQKSSRYGDKSLLTLELIAGDLRQGIDYSKIGFEGDAGSFSLPVYSRKKVSKVSYFFDEARRGIFRRETGLSDILSGADKFFVERKTLKADSFNVMFYYYDNEREQFLWKDSWKKTDGGFLGVRLTIGNGDKTFTKTVFLPAVG